MAASSAAVAGATFAGPLCFLPNKLSTKEGLCSSPLHHRGFAGLVKKAAGKECRKSGFQPAPVASADVETRAAEGEASGPSSSGPSGSNVSKRFKTREVWRKDPAKVTYLDSQYTRFAFINEVRFSTDLDAVFAKYGNLDLREIVHILYRLQERREGRAALKLIDYLESSPVYSNQLDESTYRACLASISNYPQLMARATKLFEAAKKKGVVRMIETYNMYLAILSKRGAVDVMEDVLKQIDAVRISLSMFTILIQFSTGKSAIDAGGGNLVCDLFCEQLLSRALMGVSLDNFHSSASSIRKRHHAKPFLWRMLVADSF